MMLKDEFDDICRNTCRVAQLVKWVLIVGIAVALTTFATCSNAAVYILRDQAGNQVLLFDEKCEAAPWLSKWQKANMHYNGRDYAACWKTSGSATVIVLDEAGDITALPMAAFRRMTEG